MRITTDFSEAFKNTIIQPSVKWSGFTEVNIISGNPDHQEVEYLFDTTSDETAIEIPKDFRWPNLLKELGIFASVNQARKSGWDKDIEEGYSEAYFKKQRKVIFVFKDTGKYALAESLKT